MCTYVLSARIKSYPISGIYLILLIIFVSIFVPPCTGVVSCEVVLALEEGGKLSVGGGKSYTRQCLQFPRSAQCVSMTQKLGK